MVFGAAARYNPGFTLADCRGVAIRDVNLYHCGGMGVIAQRSRDIELRKLVIVPSPGKGRMISITADATHYVNCGGYNRMIDCTFENQKDDATNIHGLYMAVEKVGGPDQTAAPLAQLGAVRRGFHRAGDAPRTGRQQQRGDLCPPDGEVRQAPQQGLHRSHLHRAAPRRGRAHACRGGRRRISRGAHQGCRMRGNRARGLLLGSRNRMVIEDNYFHIAGAAILIEGDANYWYEQSGVRDVVIRRNLFENGNYGSPGWGSACIAVGSGIPDRETSRYHRNIRVEGNTFRVFDPRIVNLYCVDGFVFTQDNVIEYTDDYPVLSGEKRNFITRNCDNIVIEKEQTDK